MNLAQLTDTELKALAYEQITNMNAAQQALAVIERVLVERAQKQAPNNPQPKLRKPEPSPKQQQLTEKGK